MTWSSFAHIPDGFFPTGQFRQGHFPAGQTSGQWTIYPLWPLIFQVQSLAASSLSDECGEMSVLKKITKALDQECVTAMNEAESLADLTNLDTIPSTYYNYLLALVGGHLDPLWDDETKRQVAKLIVRLWMIKGTQASPGTVLRWSKLDDFLPTELWKQVIREVNSYSVTRDYLHTIRAARVQFLDSGGIPATAAESSVRWELVKEVMPIHVLPHTASTLRQETISDHLLSVTDAMVVSETAGSSESLDLITDSVSVTVTCVSACQNSCQTNSETCLSCETSCQAACEASCQINGESGCDLTCQTGCQISACQTACESTGETA